MNAETALIWDQVKNRCDGFPPQAFAFVQEGLLYTVGRLFDVDCEELALDEEFGEEPSQHVSGAQLCHGLRDYAIKQYGQLARTVLERWNIRSTDDFGRIVFLLVEAGLMSKTDDDSMMDFQRVFAFEEAFGEPGVC